MSRNVFGIDLGTTNSAIAWVRDGRAEVIEYQGESIMPSVVGLDEQDRLVVGTAARNQLIAFPERTVASIKRKMGSDERVQLGKREHAPEEISAMILNELARRAREVTGEQVEQVVITVPAFFRDAQRQATLAAGRIAGLDVVRVINEPTAAALAFEPEDPDRERYLLVYDLGGGTFDVSVVRAQAGLVEVLASHGDVHLGGDDFDRLIADDLARRLLEDGHDDPRADRVLDARLIRAAEQAKLRLTEETETRVREEFLGTRAGQPAHMDLLFGRERFETLITPLLEKTLDSVHRSLSLAGRALSELDDVLLAGGSTRSPIVARRLAEVLGPSPRRDVHPDLCVALGAAVQGARSAGQDARVLVDVTPYSFGPSYFGELDGRPTPHCYEPLIERGTPLPVTRSDTYCTMFDGQNAWDARIFQGESPNAQENILVGRFLAEGLSDVPAGNEVLCTMRLDLDGILHVEAVEKRTGLARKVRIEGAAAAWTEERLAEARRRTAALWGEDAGDVAAPDADPEPVVTLPRPPAWIARARSLSDRGRGVRGQMAPEDREELDELTRRLEETLHEGDEGAAGALVEELENLVHYVEEA